MLPDQDAHKDFKGQRGRKRKFGPMDTKHTVTSVVFMQQEHIVASSCVAQPPCTPAFASTQNCTAQWLHDSHSQMLISFTLLE